MTIEFADLCGEGGWVGFDSALAAAGLAAAPGPVADAAREQLRVASGIDPTFGLTGVRLTPEAALPACHHDHDLLRIVFAGTLVIEVLDDEPTVVEVGPGRFARVDAGTTHRVRSGPEGATYVETWPLAATEVTTTWTTPVAPAESGDNHR